MPLTAQSRAMASSFFRFFFEITHSDTPQSAGLLWTSDQPVAETSTRTTHNTHNRQTAMLHPVRFEPTVPASERPQTHALDGAATRTGLYGLCPVLIMMMMMVMIKTLRFGDKIGHLPRAKNTAQTNSSGTNK